MVGPMSGQNSSLAYYYQLPYLTFSDNESPLDFQNSAFIDYLINTIQAFPTQSPYTGSQLNDPNFGAFDSSNALFQ